MLKMYIVLLNDIGLSVGKATAQAVHLGLEGSGLPDCAEWSEESNTVVILDTNTKTFEKLSYDLMYDMVHYTTFIESDFGDSPIITGLVFILDDTTYFSRYCSGLKLFPSEAFNND